MGPSALSKKAMINERRDLIVANSEEESEPNSGRVPPRQAKSDVTDVTSREICNKIPSFLRSN